MNPANPQQVAGLSAPEKSSTYRLHFEIDELPKTVNAQTSMHWTRKSEYVRGWYSMVWAAVGKRKPLMPLLRAKLTLTRFSASEPDYDGLVSSFKPVIDGLIRCGVLKDDKVSNIGRSEYRWAKAPPKKGRIVVTVEEVSG